MEPPPRESASNSASSATNGLDKGKGKASMVPSGSDNAQDPEEALFREISAKKAKIVQGFPLASMVGAASVMRYTDPHYPVPFSNFPSVAAGTPDFAQDPSFAPYAREMNAIMHPAGSLQPPLSQQDANRLFTRTLETFSRAQAHHGRNMDGLWKDSPYDVSTLKQTAYQAGTSYKLRTSEAVDELKNVRNGIIADQILDQAHIPYPLPISQTAASLPAVAPLIYDPADPPKRTSLTEEQKSQVQKAENELKSFIKQHADYQPIPLVAPPSPVKSRTSASASPVPPSRASSPGVYVSGSDSQSLQPGGGSQTPKREFQNTGMFSPISMAATSSPDPMAIIAPAYRPMSTGHKKTISTSHIVVEIPSGGSRKRRSSTEESEVKPRKRPAAVDSRGKPIKPATAVGRNVFSEYTSEADELADVKMESDDEGSYVTSTVATSSAKRPEPSSTTPKKRVKSSTAGVSGEKELEAQLEKFTDFLQDIFEAEDAIVMESDDARPDVETYFMLDEETDTSSPLMQPTCMSRLMKALNSLLRATGGRKAMEHKVEPEHVSRLLKILQRGIVQVEDLQMVSDGVSFAAAGSEPPSAASSPKKPAKGKKKKGATVVAASQTRRSSRSATPASYDERDGDEPDRRSEEDSDEEAEFSQSTPSRTKRKTGKGRKSESQSQARSKSTDKEARTWTDADLDSLEENLVTLRNAVQAIDLAMALLTSGRLEKQVYSEDLITSCLMVLKTHLPSIIYPVLDLEHGPLGAVMDAGNVSSLVRAIMQNTAAALPKITALLRQEEMAESVIIKAVYVAIAPCFVEQAVKGKAKGEALGVSELKVIRAHALGLVQAIFARYAGQRQWVIEEVLSSVTKLPEVAKRKPQYLLRNGQAIQTVSVLLLHMVQSCTSGVRQDMLSAARKEDLDEAKETEVAAIYSKLTAEIAEPAFRAATMCAKAIVHYLVQRSSKAPKNSSASEAEYKAVLDHLVKDLLVVVDLPEWPVAAMILQIAARELITVLEDPKVSADVNTAKGICLELLGCIGARVQGLITSAANEEAEATQESSGDAEAAAQLRSIGAIVRDQDRKALKHLASTEEHLIQLLLSTSGEDYADHCIDYLLGRWATDVQNALRALAQLAASEDYKPKFEIELSKRSVSAWQVEPTTGYQSNANETQQAITEAYKRLLPARGIMAAMEPLLAHILQACEGAVIAFRQKALKALSSIVEQDSRIYFQPAVRLAVEKRLMDSSPAVRDSALEMLGRYVVYNPELATQYLPRIAERVTDSGLSVRKRVIKLLKGIYPVVSDPAARIDICRRLVARVNDEDDGVKDLAASAVEELCFSSKTLGKRKAGDSDETALEKRDTASRASIVMAVAGTFREKPSPLEETVRLIISKHKNPKNNKSKDSMAIFVANLKALVEALVDALIDESGDDAKNIVNRVKTIYILLLADESMLSVQKADLLLPYLKAATTPEEQITAEYLLKIFTAVLPHMPKSAGKFAHSLQAELRALLNKPATIGQALSDLVACFCTVVVTQTFAYGNLCEVFKACYARLQTGTRRLTDTVNPASPEERAQLFRNMPILARMVALFCQHASFDRLRQSSPDAALFIDTICRESVQDEVYNQMIKVYHLSAGTALHSTALQCLGFLYRAYPTYMTSQSSAEIMDRIFRSTSAEAKAMLLRNVCDFLVSQSARLRDEDREEIDDEDLNMDQFIGNDTSFADSGVSAAIIQRYQQHILAAASDPFSPPVIMRPALDIIAFTIKQGLAHPMQCLPVLVALETSRDAVTVQKAFSLHSLLHDKHTALVNTRIGESVQAAYRYQQTLAKEGPARGFTIDPLAAHFARWYSLMREKRPLRLEFLKAMVRGLQVESDHQSCSQDMISLARYTAENMATLEYKTQEEVFFIIRSCMTMLSMMGMQLYHQVQDSDMQVDGETSPDDDLANTARKTVILGIVFYLRNHLKALYGVTDQKLSKYTVGKKSAAGDKPAVTKGGQMLPLSLASLPFAFKPMVTAEDFADQIQAYINMIDSDGTIREQQQDDEEDSD